ALEMKRRSEGAEDVLHGDEVPHLLLGDAEDHLAPPARVGVVGERVGGVEILHHQRMLDLRRDVQQEDGVVAPVELLGERDIAVRPDPEQLGFERGGGTEQRLEIACVRSAHILGVTIARCSLPEMRGYRMRISAASAWTGYD